MFWNQGEALKTNKFAIGHVYTYMYVYTQFRFLIKWLDEKKDHHMYILECAIISSQVRINYYLNKYFAFAEYLSFCKFQTYWHMQETWAQSLCSTDIVLLLLSFRLSSESSYAFTVYSIQMLCNSVKIMKLKFNNVGLYFWQKHQMYLIYSVIHLPNHNQRHQNNYHFQLKK